MSASHFIANREGDATVLTITPNRVDLLIADDLGAGLRRVAADARGAVVVDMANVTFLDSSGLGALVSVSNSLPAERKMRIRNPTPFVREVLRLTKLDRIFLA